MVNTKIIADLPIELGIKRTYKGYFFLIAALELAITDQKNLLYMSQMSTGHGRTHHISNAEDDQRIENNGQDNGKNHNLTDLF